MGNKAKRQNGCAWCGLHNWDVGCNQPNEGVGSTYVVCSGRACAVQASVTHCCRCRCATLRVFMTWSDLGNSCTTVQTRLNGRGTWLDLFYRLPGGRTPTGWPHTAQSGEPDCRGPEAKPHQRVTPNTPIPGGAQCPDQTSLGAEPNQLASELGGVLHPALATEAPGVCPLPLCTSDLGWSFRY
jgi:hypothetical protein